jgi:16S rRNA (cytosine967-C5)-methyltransferase
LLPRRIAADILDAVLRRRRALDDQLDGPKANREFSALEDRDRALTRRLVATVLRRLGTLRYLLGRLLDRGLPADAPRVETALLLGAAQILLLDVPDHAAVDLAVRLVQGDRRAARYAGLVNAVLRRTAREGLPPTAGENAAMRDTPEWLARRWVANYGEARARAIAAVHAQEPPLDITVKDDPQSSAERLGGRVLPTGSVRMIAPGSVRSLPGYAEGAWWVQDAAAALPARLLGDVRGRSVADLCAAPGGKTAQLAHAGAHVVAVDRSETRLARLRENFARLGLHAETVAADATEWQAGPFDAVLLDAPCSSTGTIRRHPDVPWVKREADIGALVSMQRRLLDHAVTLMRPGGTLVYCTCSLEPEECEDAIAALLDRNAGVRRRPVAAREVSGIAEFITPVGDLRTLPCHWPDPDSRWSGLDGFYAARLERI